MVTASRQRIRMFISHISDEAEMAALLAQVVEEDFDRRVEFFTSSDVGSINTGADWLGAITQAIGHAASVVVLCSRTSVHKPWVQFELGAAWMKGVTIIPVCHSGLTVNELPEPLSRLQGLDLGSRVGLERLYKGVAAALGLAQVPQPKDVNAQLARIRALESRFGQGQVQQFERYIDIVIPPPGRLDTDTIPDNATIESNADSLELFGFIPGTSRTWRDIVKAARKTADTRWLGQLQRCVGLASNNELFRPVQAIYHTDRGSYQPQLAKKEVLPDGSSRFHVHFVETVVAPLFEVQNEFGLLATLLRLGLRFRYEVIERAQRRAGVGRRNAGTGQPAADDDELSQLRCAIRVIENDALSRGAENIDRGAIADLFDSADAAEMARVQLAWEEARALLFCDDPPPTTQEMNEIILKMRHVNYRFMVLGTKRFHELVCARWSADANAVMSPVRTAKRNGRVAASVARAMQGSR